MALGIGALAIAGTWWALVRSAPDAPPLDEIGDDSRARLEALLRDADREAAP